MTISFRQFGIVLIKFHYGTKNLLTISRQCLPTKTSYFGKAWRIQRALENYDNKSLVQLEGKLKRDLKEVLAQEELLWYQKSRKDWILYGDRNTTFFHNKTITQRKKSCTEAIKDESSQWLFNNEEIKGYAINFFSNLYTNKNKIHYLYPFSGFFFSLLSILAHYTLFRIYLMMRRLEMLYSV